MHSCRLVLYSIAALFSELVGVIYKRSITTGAQVENYSKRVAAFKPAVLVG